MNKNRTSSTTVKLVELAIFAAIIIVLQLLGGAVKVGPVSFSLVLVPIVIGGILIGPLGGALLGAVFGVMTLIGGLTGADIFTATLLQSGTKGAVITTLLCLVKATAAGLGAALLYKLIRNKNKFAAVVTAAAAAPIINTGLFILGALSLSDVLSANFVAEGTTVIYFLVIGCAGVNFIVELLVNLVLSPAVYRFITAVMKGRIA